MTNQELMKSFERCQSFDELTVLIDKAQNRGVFFDNIISIYKAFYEDMESTKGSDFATKSNIDSMVEILGVDALFPSLVERLRANCNTHLRGYLNCCSNLFRSIESYRNSCDSDAHKVNYITARDLYCSVMNCKKFDVFDKYGFGEDTILCNNMLCDLAAYVIAFRLNVEIGNSIGIIRNEDYSRSVVSDIQAILDSAELSDDITNIAVRLIDYSCLDISEFSLSQKSSGVVDNDVKVVTGDVQYNVANGYKLHAKFDDSGEIVSFRLKRSL